MSQERLIGSRFRIDDLERDLLGRGGMGDVYRATDLQTGQSVAIKALRPEVVSGDPNALARFTREGEALRQLNHPNIVQVVDGIEQDGRHYLVMEYVPGGSLRDLLEETSRPDRSGFDLSGLPIERTVEIALDVADALTRAHRLGILHRDLKPANVLLAEDDTPRLTDFGHAHLATAPRLTQTGTVVGTVLYLSPEALRGETLDVRADIWAFGVMLYELLAGQVPFPGETYPEVFMAILGQPVPDVQRAAASQARPEVPDALADLVYRMLEKERGQRIPSVRLVGAELEAVLQSCKFDHRSANVKGWQVGRPRRPSIAESRFATLTPSVEGAEQPQAHDVRASEVRRPPHNLPVQPTSFVGRDAELVALDQLLKEPDVRLVTILGAGGMGKTRLALEVARAQVERFEDGVYMVSLAPLRAAETLVPAVANAVGLDFYPGGDPRKQLLGYLRNKRLLLVLDNFEHLLAEHSLGSVELVSDVLRSAPEVVVLATSRTALNLQDEHLYRITGLELPADEQVPTPAALENAIESSAVQLFVQSARRVRPGYELAEGDPGAAELAAVVRICRLVDGMPLGILLAASWMEMLSPEEIARELDPERTAESSDQGPGAGLDLLETDLRDLPQRQRSMRAVFDYSWNLLTERERNVLQEASVFRGGFTREAVQEITSASLHDLRALVNRSLLHRSPTGRYVMHELLRQYAREKLNRRLDALGAVRDRHSAFYAAALSQWGRDLQGARQRVAAAEMEDDLGNIRAAWDWAVDQGRTEWLAQALDGVCLFYSWRRRSAEGAAACNVAATAPESGRRAMQLRARALAWQSHFAEKMGDIESAEQLAGHSLAILDQLDSETSQAARSTADCQSAFDIRSHRALALWSTAMYTYQIDVGQTTKLFERSLALYRAVNDRWWAGRTLFELSRTASWRGQRKKAEQLTQESLAVFRSLGDRWGCASALSDLGSLAMYSGRMDEAERLKRQALTEAEGSRGWDETDISLDKVYLDSGKFTQALPGFERRAALYGELGLKIRLVEATEGLLFCLLHLGRYERAHTLAQDNLKRCIEAGYRLYTGEAHRAIAKVELVRKHPSVAQRHLNESVRILRETVGGSSLAESLANLGYAERALSQAVAAEQQMAEALGMDVDGRFWLPLLELMPGLALLLADKGQIERALELYALASCHPYVANSCWFEDVAGRHIAAAAATLPPEAIAAAQERGQARDLWATAKELLTELQG